MDWRLNLHWRALPYGEVAFASMVKSWERTSRKIDLPFRALSMAHIHLWPKIISALSMAHVRLWPKIISAPQNKIYHKRIPQLGGDSVIVAHCSRWFLLSQKDHDPYLSLWNPTISHSSPTLLLKPTQEICHYLFSAPPGDPDCMVILFENVLHSSCKK